MILMASDISLMSVHLTPMLHRKAQSHRIIDLSREARSPQAHLESSQSVGIPPGAMYLHRDSHKLVEQLRRIEKK